MDRISLQSEFALDMIQTCRGIAISCDQWRLNARQAQWGRLKDSAYYAHLTFA